MSSKSEQGWINQYRKPVLFFGAAVLLLIWFLLPPLYPLPDHLRLLLKDIGALLMIVAVIGRFVSALTIASFKNQMVARTEMYSIVRHPLYLFSLINAIGFGCMVGRLEFALLVPAVYLACFYPMMLNEEKYLEKTLGSRYITYKKSTPRLLPNFRRWRPRRNAKVNLRQAIATLPEAAITLLVIALMKSPDYLA